MADPQFTTIVGPAGVVRHVPSGQVSTLPKNWRVASPEEEQRAQDAEEFGGTGGMAGAAAIGLGQAATLGFGLGGVIEGVRAFDPESAEEMARQARGVREAAPLTSVGTEIGGTLALATLTGGASVAARGGLGGGRLAARALTAPMRLGLRAGAAVERGIARVAPKALGEFAPQVGRAAVEGAYYGGVDAFTESALHNTELTGEKLAIGMGSGALIGGGMGLGIAGVSRAATAVGSGAKRALGSAFDKIDPEAVERLALKAFGHKAKGIGKLVADYGAEGKALRALTRDPEALSKLSEELYQSLIKTHATTHGTGQQLTGFLKANQMRRVMKTGNEDAVLAHMKVFVGQELDVLEDLVRKKGLYGGVTTKGNKILKDTRNELRRMNAQIDQIAEMGAKDQSTRLLMAADQTKQSLDRVVDTMGKRAKFAVEREAVAKMRGVADRFRNLLVVDDLWGGAARLQRDMNAPWSKMIGETEGFHKAFLKKVPSPVHGAPADTIVDRGKVYRYVKNIVNPDADVAHKALRGHLVEGETFVAAGRKNMKLDPKAQRMIAAFSDDAKRTRDLVGKIEDTAVTLNQFEQIKSLDADAGVLGGLGGVVGGAMLGGPAGAAVGAMLGMARRPGAAIGKIAAFEALTHRITRRMNGSVGDYFRRATKSTIVHGHRLPQLAAREVRHQKARDDSLKEFQRQRLLLQDQVRRPERAYARAADELSVLGGLPDSVITSAAADLQRGEEYLLSHLPIGLNDPESLMGITPAASRTEAEEWLRRADVVRNPYSVLKDLAKGTLSHEQVDALKTVHPAIYGELRSTVMDHILDAQGAGKSLPYSDRIQLGVLLDIPTDPTLNHEIVLGIQASYAEPEAGPPGPEQRAKTPGRPAGRKAPNLAASFQTGTEKLEASEEG